MGVGVRGLLGIVLLAAGCGDSAASTDGGVRALDAVSPPTDSTRVDSGSDAGGAACDGRSVGDQFLVGDGCNFCECLSDGSVECTRRRCDAVAPSCEYEGVVRPYGVRFPAYDGVNECICASRGLACTRRDETLPEEGVILVEDLSEPCGIDPTFSAEAVLAELEHRDMEGPLVFDRTGSAYPETLPDTTLRVRLDAEDGFIVCRVGAQGRAAFDVEWQQQWTSLDGSFDERFQAHLRRNGFGGGAEWFMAALVPTASLDGSYDPACPLAAAVSFELHIVAGGATTARLSKTCEMDLLTLPVGTAALAPRP